MEGKKKGKEKGRRRKKERESKTEKAKHGGRDRKRVKGKVDFHPESTHKL